MTTLDRPQFVAPVRATPSIPTISGDLSSHTKALHALKECVEIHERRTKDIVNSFLRVQELIDLGVVEVKGNQIVLSPTFIALLSGQSSVPDNGGGSGGTDVGSILTSNGDLLTRIAGSLDRLGIGSEGQILTVSSGLPSWETPSAGGGLANDLDTEILADSPTGYWPCNETSGTDLLDASGNGLDLALGGTYTQAFSPLVDPNESHILIGGGASDGGLRAGTLGITPPFNFDWTIEAVYQPRTSPVDDQIVFAIQANGESEATNVQALLDGDSAGALRFGWEFGGGSNALFSSPMSLLPYQTYHVIAVKDSTASTVTLWINGRKIIMTAYANEPSGGSSCNTYLGRSDGSPNDPKVVGFVAFYESALSDARCAQHFRASGYLRP